MKEEFIKIIIKNPIIKAEYERQSWYYREYVWDDWTDDMFRFDKPFFYEIIWKMVCNLVRKDNKSDEEFFTQFIKNIKEEEEIFINTK